ncbi:MAG: IS21 family transposase [Thermodesulfobacteriota bacterium]
MRKIKEVLRLKWCNGLSDRKTAKSCSIARSTVADYVWRADRAGLSWPLSEDMDEAELDRLLFPAQTPVPPAERFLPEWSYVYGELKRKGVTKFLLWHEYKERCAEGYQYSRFCQRYRAWLGKLNPVMRQEHRAGEKLFVDYAGHTVPVVNRITGEVKEAQIFVAVLGASSYTYAEATWSQSTPDWIGSHVRAFEYYGGVTEIVIPDNLKAGVTKACRYEPDVNPTYQEMARHYGTAVIPARVRKPRDKAKVEAGVLVVERWIVARLRNLTFFSLTQLNSHIRRLLVDLNERPFKKLPGSRKSFFDTLDKPALKPLPASPYQYAEWKKARVNIDYHIEVDRHYYSVPCQLIKKEVDIRITAATIECLYRGKRVASHMRSYNKGRHTTVPGHMPKAHQKYAEWTPERLISWAAKSGADVSELTRKILVSRVHPQQGYRTVLGILRLGKRYGEKRLNSACRRALVIGATTYKSVESILKAGLDQRPLPETLPDSSQSIEHPNIRGADYYN